MLSDPQVKSEYDQLRSAQNQSNPYASSSGNSSSSYSRQSSSYSSQSNNYRGYHREEGWKNKTFRQDFINDLYRQQANERMRDQYK